MGRNEYLTMADQAHAMAQGVSPAAADELERMASDFQSMADKQSRGFTRIVVVVAVVLAAYFALAFYLKSVYVDAAPKGRVVFQILLPFQRYNFAAVPYRTGLDSLNELGDDPYKEGDDRSPIMLYENNKPLGPAHSTFHDIYHFGAGRFSHLNNQLVFSTSDNSDPNTNGRSYWVVLP